MKRLVTYKFDPSSKWAVLSGILMGIALFTQVLDFLGLRNLASVPFFQLLVMLILPLAAEAAWCVCLRLIRLDRAEVYGILSGAGCLFLLLQTFYYGNVLLTLLFIPLLLVAGAAVVLVSWGMIPRRGLGLLVLLAVALIRVLVVVLSRLRGGYDWMGLLNDLPSVCILLASTCFLGSLKATEHNE